LKSVVLFRKYTGLHAFQTLSK